MTATELAAWVGASSGLGSLLWNVYTKMTSGPKLIVNARPGMEMLAGKPMPNAPREKYVVVSVRNTGTTRTTITSVWFSTYESRWARARQKRTKSGVVPQPLGPLPHKLDVGEEYVGGVKQTECIEEMLQTGKLWCEVVHSWSKRPAQAKVER